MCSAGISHIVAGMSHISDLLPAITDTPRFVLLLPAGNHHETLHQLTAWLAVKNGVQIQDCACAFNATHVMQLLRLQTIAVLPAMAQIQIARAFTAYQLQTMLTQTSATLAPILIFNLLHLLYDDNIQTPEAFRLLHLFIAQLNRLRQTASIVASIRQPPTDQPDRHGLLHLLTQQADTVLAPKMPATKNQLKLAF